jgi:hypothetical protein
MAKWRREFWARWSSQSDGIAAHPQLQTSTTGDRRPGGIVLWAMLCLAVAGCTPRAPAGPTVMALPAKGEGFALFEQHDATCRQYAVAQTGGASPGRTAASSGVGGAVVGTGVGAAAGALLGSASGHAGAGAAIGAGSGLLAGGLLGSARGRRSAASIQSHYNMSYTQCMVANGESIAPPVPPPTVYVAPYPSAVYVPPAIYVPPPGGS